MASSAAPPSTIEKLKEDLTCAICCDVFQDPVMLTCMHHFCRKCITRYWRGTQVPVTCPQCRKVFLSKHFETSYLVAGIVAKVQNANSEALVKNLEKRREESLESLRLRIEEFNNFVRKDKEKMKTIKRVVSNLQERVKGEFQALHKILHEEQTYIEEQLMREQEEELQKVQRHLEAVRLGLMELEDNVNRLQQRGSASGNDLLTELPSLRVPAQVEIATDFDINAFSDKYMGPLQYITWRRMLKSLKPGPSALTFDADTAHSSIHVSEDKTVALECDVVGNVPIHNKRFLQCVNVLASQGFHSGRHYWEVDVGSSPKWDVGVASEAVDRHARIKLSPDNGYWTLRLRNRNEYSAGTQPWTRLQLVSPPQRLGVFLNCEERKVSFYNAEDMSLICSFTNGPRGKVFPFFSPCINGRRNPRPLKLPHYLQIPLSG